MLLHNLFEDLTDADVAALMSGPKTVQPKLKHKPLTPGAKRNLKIHIADLEDKYNQIRRYHSSLSQFMSMMPPGLEEDLIQLEKEYKEAIEAELQLLKGSMQDARVYKFLDGVTSKCSDAVNAMRQAGTLLYRGTSNAGDIYIGKPHNNRRVMTSSSTAQEIYDEKIAQAGFKALRGNSIFTSGDTGLAFNFGSSKYMIFPVNGFQFTWSRSKRDIVIGADDIRYWMDEDLIESIWSKVFLNPELKKEFMNRMGMSYYLDKDYLPSDFAKDNIGSYDGFLGYSNGETHLKKLKAMEADNLISGIPDKIEDLITPEQVVKYMDLTHEDFVGALKSQNEICIRGTYYAVHYKHYQMVKQYLKIGDEPQ